MPLEFPKGSITLDFAKKAVPSILAEDVEGSNYSTVVTASAAFAGYYNEILITNGVDLTLATKTLNFDANSLAFAAGFASACEYAATSDIVLHLYMGGVLMQTSAELPLRPHMQNFVLRDFKALSGNQECKLTAYQLTGSDTSIRFYLGDATSQDTAAIAVGSVKLS